MAMLGERDFSFCNKSLSNTLLGALIRQRQDWHFCDVLIKVCGQEIGAHSNVLAAVSPYFAAFFGQDLPRSFSQKAPQTIEIRIEGCRDSNAAYEEAVTAIVEYMYTGVIWVRESNVSQIAEIAKTIQLDDVVQFCDDFNSRNVSNDDLFKHNEDLINEVVEKVSDLTDCGPVKSKENASLHLLLSNLPNMSQASGYSGTSRTKPVRMKSIATQVRPSFLGIQSSPGEMRDQSTSTDKRIFWDFGSNGELAITRKRTGVSSGDDIVGNKIARVVVAENEHLEKQMDVEVGSCNAFSNNNKIYPVEVKCENDSLILDSDGQHRAFADNRKEQLLNVIKTPDASFISSGLRQSCRLRRRPLKLLDAEIIDEKLGRFSKENSDFVQSEFIELRNDYVTDEMMQVRESKSSETAVMIHDAEVLLAGDTCSNGSEASVGTFVGVGNETMTSGFSKARTFSLKPKKRSADFPTKAAGSKKFHCDSCAFATNNVRSMSAHNKLHKMSDNICYYCELKFPEKKLLELHMLEHSSQTMPFLCRFCHQHFQSRTQLMLHLPKHSDEKPYICEVCSVGFKWKNALKNHMITHENRKEHLCDICGYATAHRCQLKAHRLVHTGETIQCPHEGCNYHATKTQNLKYHMLTHTQVKAHQCEVCGTSFSLIKNMKRHMLLHTSNKTHKCSLCDFASTRYDKLKEHLHKQHSIGTAPERRLRITDMVYQNQAHDDAPDKRNSSDVKFSALSGFEHVSDVANGMKSDLEVFYADDYQMLELPDGVQVDGVKDAIQIFPNQTIIIAHSTDDISNLALQSHMDGGVVVDSVVRSLSPNPNVTASENIVAEYSIEDVDHRDNSYICS